MKSVTLTNYFVCYRTSVFAGEVAFVCCAGVFLCLQGGSPPGTLLFE